MGNIPKPLQDAEFSVSQGLNIKALFCKNGQSLLRSNNDESKCLWNAQGVGLKAIYTALLILTIEPLLFAINALPKSLLNPTETHNLRWFGYKL
ncbi:hypothetical protein CWB85_08870 [Pseudoalteromonas sp. S1727]|nr:hypothetical protein CWB85_08870 [Pseudoalteromonas sp. S1727]